MDVLEILRECVQRSPLTADLAEEVVIFKKLSFSTHIFQVTFLQAFKRFFQLEFLTYEQRSTVEQSNNCCCQKGKFWCGDSVNLWNIRKPKARCAKFVNKQNEERYYVKSAEALPWSEAYSTCQAKGGQLAVPNAADELSFLAGYAAVEGSWLGIIYDEPSNTWTWLDSNPDAVLLSEDSYWAFEQPYLEIDSTSILCGTIAPSGSAHNMYSQTCISKFSYICEYEVPTEFCQKGDIEDLTKEDYVYTMPQIDQCTGDEGLDTLRFFETLSLPQLDEITADDQFCYDNFTGSSAKSYNDLVCCS
eukprot:TRINITY_DN12168_c0_g2_i11.p1 TRINITY_DN12168_c0_g2~~TRINITY_DN12168_c0_g2_i11.p1  ORF type:complete len:304 (-),score=22.01 TRINITY_DN12168_c0_g2_i11:521-1432(-)